jgi:Arc/MetJ-type ribon-helix-helix transcriptional regulator
MPVAMTSLQIDLPEDVRRLADEEVASGRFASLSDYLATLIRQDRASTADENVRKTLRARLQSGSSQEMGDADFDRIRDRLLSHLLFGYRGRIDVLAVMHGARPDDQVIGFVPGARSSPAALSPSQDRTKLRQSPSPEARAGASENQLAFDNLSCILMY